MSVKKKVAVAFYRTLASQSAASISGGLLAGHLRQAHDVNVLLLESKQEQAQLSACWDCIFYKPNFKDIGAIEQNIKTLKEANPACRIFLFGPYPFLNASAMLDMAHIEGILRPNLEYLAPALVDSSDFSCLLTKDKAHNDKNDSLSIDDEKLFSIHPVRDVEKNEPIFIANIEASRGCQMGCSFCHVGVITKKTKSPIIVRKVNDVMEEIRSLMSLGKRYIIFNDAVLGGFIDNREWVTELCDKIHEMEEKPYFMAYMTLHQIQKPGMIETLRRGNFIRIFTGIESSTANSLKYFNKSVAAPHFSGIKKRLLENFMVPHIGFMLFQPFSQPAEIMENIKYMLECDELHRFGVIVEKTRALPGTPLHEKIRNAGLLSACGSDYRFASDEVAVIYNTFMKFFDKTGLPVFERIEHLFTTSEYIINIVSKDYASTDGFYVAAQDIRDMKAAYSSVFYSLCDDLSSMRTPQSFDFSSFRIKLENARKALTAEAEKAGLERPMEWLANGSHSPERGSSIDEPMIETRTGFVEKAC